MKITHIIADTTEIRREHGPGRIQLVDLSNLGEIDLELELARYDELPVAAALALELLRAAAECETSDEPSTRETARVHLLALRDLAYDLVRRLDDADSAVAAKARALS